MSFTPLERTVPWFFGMFLFLAFAATSQAAPQTSEKITMHSEVVDTPNDAFAYIDRLNVFPDATPFAPSSTWRKKLGT
jgi:hypothetical protein